MLSKLFQFRCVAVVCVTWLALLSDVKTRGVAQEKNTATATSSIWDPAGIQDFTLTDRSGAKVSKKDLLGKEWVAGFIFTRCKGPCPDVVGQMKKLQEQTGVSMVVFSVQPEVDTPDVLKSFSTNYVPKVNPDANGKVPDWYWLTGDRAEIYRLIEKSFKMPAAVVKGPMGFEVIHSNNLMHVDEEGRVLGKYNALEPAEMVLLRQILQGKAPRGKMLTGSAQPAGERIENTGAQAAGLTLTRTTDEETDQAEGPAPATPPEWVLALPTINASLNGLATILLLAGYVCIKQKKVFVHKWLMISSFLTSIIFLGCYLVYHFNVLTKKFPGTGTIKTIYLLILFSHIVLAALVPFLAMTTMYRAFRGQWDKHRAIAKITFPIWVYVSVTGVVIYFMLYHWPVAS